MASEEDLSKYFTGKHEVQECLQGQRETDLPSHLANCEKNPIHKIFIPVNQFSLEHFPSDYRDNDLYHFTKGLADLTIRIAVKYTSPDRPEFLPGTTDPYPGYNIKGQNSLRTGTGKVLWVKKYTEGEDDDMSCPCPECDFSDTPSKVWWGVVAVTARHVIFNESEARQSTCRLWFDDNQSPVLKIYGSAVGDSNTKEDLCFLYCVSHDLDIGDKLKKMVDRSKGLWKKVSEKYKSRKHVEKLTIIVSHPHGCVKQVSVGHWVHRQVVEGRRTRYTYTTCTCPGSSGALVYRLGCSWGSFHPHIGGTSNPNSSRLNYSGVWFDKEI
ncbi:uncharacterized protein LOC131956196 [Physella acuta]|uniref:uncharacterized protein LOC131956196 n=1 Tax=Physella acuta TaxID=109671 RepID=UPI0027DB7FDF|nr:uncharacterized protein LOC131956196 [Physella acuta]